MGIEDKTAGAESDDVIVVMPEGGVIGMYTDWVDQSPAQKWETFHLAQLVPFLDRNLRTIGTKESRAIVGFSMGGLGAMRYAEQRPDLFAAVASLSGVVDLQHLAFQAGLLVTLQQQGVNPAGPFGDVLNSAWSKANPSRHASKLATVKPFIYVGEGTDPVELVCTQSGYVLSKALTDARIAHLFKNYGTPGGKCNGGHTLDCSEYAFADVFPHLLEVLADPR